MRAARARVHGGMGGVALRRRRVGAVAALHGWVDDCAAVRGIVALVKHSRAAWLLSSVAAWPMRGVA